MSLQRLTAKAVQDFDKLPAKCRPKFGRERALPPMTRTQVADDAGMSEHQRKTALRIASVPDGEFEAAVESDTPPTATALAERGTAGKPRGA
jgi:hypothetical protein